MASDSRDFPALMGLPRVGSIVPRARLGGERQLSRCPLLSKRSAGYKSEWVWQSDYDSVRIQTLNMTQVTFYYDDPRTRRSVREVMELSLPPFTAEMGWEPSDESVALLALIAEPPPPPPPPLSPQLPLAVVDIPLPPPQVVAPQQDKQRKARVQKGAMPQSTPRPVALPPKTRKVRVQKTPLARRALKMAQAAAAPYQQRPLMPRLPSTPRRPLSQLQRDLFLSEDDEEEEKRKESLKRKRAIFAPIDVADEPWIRKKTRPTKM